MAFSDFWAVKMNVWGESRSLEELKLGKGKCSSEDVEPAGQRSIKHTQTLIGRGT